MQCLCWGVHWIESAMWANEVRSSRPPHPHKTIYLNLRNCETLTRNCWPCNPALCAHNFDLDSTAVKWNKKLKFYQRDIGKFHVNLFQLILNRLLNLRDHWTWASPSGADLAFSVILEPESISFANMTHKLLFCNPSPAGNPLFH